MKRGNECEIDEEEGMRNGKNLKLGNEKGLANGFCDDFYDFEIFNLKSRSRLLWHVSNLFVE